MLTHCLPVPYWHRSGVSSRMKSQRASQAVRVIKPHMQAGTRGLQELICSCSGFIATFPVITQRSSYAGQLMHYLEKHVLSPSSPLSGTFIKAKERTWIY